MSPKTEKSILRPEDVPAEKAQKVLAFLNTVKTAEELAEAIEVPGERDVGIRVAKNVLATRKELGRFKDIRQVTDVPQVGPERFKDIVNAFSRTGYVIEGQLKSTGRVDFAKAKLAVHAFVGDVEVARADVDGQGRYKLAFEHMDKPPATELRVIPAKFSHRCSKTLTFSKTFSPSRYMKKSKPLDYYATYDMYIPLDYIVLVQTITKTYHLHGAVYATKFIDVGGVPTPISIEPLPAAKIEFYEVDAPIIFILGTEPELTEAYLGYAYTGPDGSYDFEFDFSYKHSPWIWTWLFTDKKPDIRARISQFKDGIWMQVYEGPVDWDIVEDFARDYFVPEEDTIPIPDAGIKPDEGFRYTSIGLLPIDTTRIVKGYATAQLGDPGRISTVSHQPFCGTLRIFGLFAESPPVANYRVQIADADEDGPTGTWRDVTDSLHNRKWNSAMNKWDPLVLGPDPATGLYQNIDTEPEADWNEHALKATWNSANEPNGYYALRIIGYDASDTEVGTFEMPVMRVDNDRPDASLETLDTVMGPVTECGDLELGVSPNRWIRFRITAHDTEGHVLRYWLSGTRGKEALSAGTTLSEWRPDPGATWTGVKNVEKQFEVALIPASLAGCPALAYNFELHVHGLATDGYDKTPGSQRIKKETNLIVSEP
ncbi:hypothetical protein D4R42_03490 [bacterium]|nr:MAG: hypothetical protein D4R42_03490 [bacterium]